MGVQPAAEGLEARVEGAHEVETACSDEVLLRLVEDTLGTPLLLRMSRRVQLTAAGRTLLAEAPAALAVLDSARRCATSKGWVAGPDRKTAPSATAS
jgi:DNA-binding transcriptional LysR family regulator